MTQFANRSFWIDDYGGYAPNAPLQTDGHVDVAIVGGGFTGLSTALNIREQDASASVAVLESEIVGFGSSGRNQGWVMTMFGLDIGMVKQLYGRDRAKAGYRYCADGLDYVEQLIERHDLDSDFERIGEMQVATGDTFLPALEAVQELHEELEIDGHLEWLDKDEIQAEFNSPLMTAGLFDPDMGVFNPCKHVRELKRLAEKAGAAIYENTPAVDIRPGNRTIEIQTPRATITADRLVIATNAFTHLLPGEMARPLRRDQAPLFAQITVTEPLTEEQMEAVGWKRRCAVKDMLNLYHGFNVYKDRLLLCFHHHIEHGTGLEMNRDFHAETMNTTMRHFGQMFPCLKDVKKAQSWGGPISATFDMVPHIGFLEGERVIYATGCWGHGVSGAHQNGRTFADLVLGKTTDRTDFWVVGRKPRKWPAGPLGSWGRSGVLAYMRWEDRGKLKKTPFEL